MWYISNVLHLLLKQLNLQTNEWNLGGGGTTTDGGTEGTILREVTQARKDKYGGIYLLICGHNLLSQ